LSFALLAAGIQTIRGSRHVARGTPDEVWLDECGQRGWTVLTRDKRIRYRVLERTALRAAGVRAFVFTGGNVSLAQTVEAVLRALPAMARIVATTPAPFIFHFGVAGRPVRMD
jgi:hypothetical protein